MAATAFSSPGTTSVTPRADAIFRVVRNRRDTNGKGPNTARPAATTGYRAPEVSLEQTDGSVPTASTP